MNIGWGVNRPGLPSLYFNFLEGHTDYSIYGENSDSTSAFHSFNVHAYYQIAGFNLNGGYVNSAYSVAVPGNLHQRADRRQRIRATTDSILALRTSSPGTAPSLPTTTTPISTPTMPNTTYSGAVDVVNAAATFHPIDRLDVGLSSNYTNNLLGALYQNIITSGGVMQQNTPGTTSTSFDVDGYGSYKFTEHIFAARPTLTTGEQSYLGSSFNGTTVTGSVTYWKHLLGGTFQLGHSAFPVVTITPQARQPQAWWLWLTIPGRSEGGV